MRKTSRPKAITSVAAMNSTNCSARMLSSPNACTDWTMPLRVMNVPKIVRKNVKQTSARFQRFIMPRCSWMIADVRTRSP